MNPIRTFPRLHGLVLALAAAVLVSGCDDDLFQQRWTANPQDGLIFALSRDELNVPSAFSVYEGRTYRVEAPGSSGRWDLAFDIVDGQPVFLPPGAVGISSEARLLARPGETFESIRRAPDDLELYSEREPVPVVEGQLYVVRTAQQIGVFGSRCVYFGKLVVQELDLVSASVLFRYDVNTICNSRRLQPDR